ncbi:hypothetical protein [Bartonella sp. MU37NMGALS]|uniref:hypothetical protein n=1 Tax=Bartonella sp. MU37NMGALS TaxID=3243560 RepID=UPI0035D12281
MSLSVEPLKGLEQACSLFRYLATFFLHLSVVFFSEHYLAKFRRKNKLEARRHGFCSWLVKTIDVSYDGLKAFWIMWEREQSRADLFSFFSRSAAVSLLQNFQEYIHYCFVI